MYSALESRALSFASTTGGRCGAVLSLGAEWWQGRPVMHYIDNQGAAYALLTVGGATLTGIAWRLSLTCGLRSLSARGGSITPRQQRILPTFRRASMLRRLRV